MGASSIENVADTAFLVAYHRAAESARPDALFQDSLAGRLAGEHGRQIAESWPMGRMLAWAVALRTVIIDDYIRAAVDAGADTILNLGAGLDTRPYRMELPPALRWIEADQARVIGYKEGCLQDQVPRCRLERVGLDLADDGIRRDLLARIARESAHVLVLTEGVVPYLGNDAVAALARDLLAHPCFRGWIVEYLSPAMRKYQQSAQKRLAVHLKNAPIRFLPSDWLGFYGDLGWRPAEVRYYPEEGKKRKRPLPLSFFKRLGMHVMLVFSARKREASRKMMGFALLEPVNR